MAHLGNPVAHPSVAEGDAACAVRGVLVRVRILGGRRGRRRLGAACFAARCTDTARVAETATEWAVNVRWLRVAQEAATPPSKRSPASSRARESPGCMMCLSVLRAESENPAYSEKPMNSHSTRLQQALIDTRAQGEHRSEV